MTRRIALAAAAALALIAAAWAALVAAFVADHAVWAATADPNHTPEGDER